MRIAIFNKFLKKTPVMKNKYLIAFLLLMPLLAISQTKPTAGPVFIDSAKVVVTKPLSSKTLIPPPRKKEEGEEERIQNRIRVNNIVPGKGLPKGIDPALQKKKGTIPSRSPSLVFTGAEERFNAPTDPTGAVGEHYYLNAWNTAFAIWDKQGNNVVPASSLSSIGGEFTGESDGDPIVLYDVAAKRYLIIQFAVGEEYPFLGEGNAALLVAVSQGSDPVNSGWYTYRFEMDKTPDYPKITLWGDSYIITTNKSPLTPERDEVVFALERNKMLQGLDNARILGFPLPGIETNGFYSPGGFNAMDENQPPSGNAPVIYFQDDSWSGINTDHLKLWLINAKWNNINSSSITLSQEISQGVSPFDSTLDPGDAGTLQQPYGPEIDVLQGVVMYMTQYRRFNDHNSAVLNFVVNIDPSGAEHAGIRWYELRQDSDASPWYVYQEGTYAPDSSDRFCGSIGLDKYGNIALGFTVLNNSEEDPLYPSIMYTGRYTNDPLGSMTLAEQFIFKSENSFPIVDRENFDFARYGDYSHLNVDPVDGITFWHNAEIFESTIRKDKIGVFKLAPNDPNDLGVTSIDEPEDATLSEAEPITISLRNFGTNSQSDFEISYSINGGPEVTEIYTGTIQPETAIAYTFEEKANLSEIGEIYSITAEVNLLNDSNDQNDRITKEVKNLPPNDVGINTIDDPETGTDLSANEDITVTIANYGGEPQSNIPLSYTLGEFGNSVNEVYTGTILPGEDAVYTFQEKANLSALARYKITASTHLEDDSDDTNDSTSKTIVHLDCTPEGSDCSQGDGISYFELEEIENAKIPCTNGYIDFVEATALLDRSLQSFTVTVQSNFFNTAPESEKFSMWIDLNDNGVFEDSERLISAEIIPEADTSFSYNFMLPDDAPLGQHLLRIRAGDTDIDSESVLNSPCEVMTYGTTHDYSVLITDSTIDVKDFLLNDADIAIISKDHEHFKIVIETVINDPLEIMVYNVLGQRLLQRKLVNSGSGYSYDLDMSYAAPGVYLLRVGTKDFGRVKRFIVK